MMVLYDHILAELGITKKRILYASMVRLDRYKRNKGLVIVKSRDSFKKISLIYFLNNVRCLL